MEGEELENAINRIKEVLDDLGDININCESTRAKLYYQKRLNKGYDKLFSLKKHLDFLKLMEERKNGIR